MNLPSARASRLAFGLFVAGFLVLVGGYAIGNTLAARDSARAIVG